MKFKTILILWPSFLVAGIVNSLFFTLFDPLEMVINGEAIFDNRVVAYSIGFFACWLFAGLSSALTLFFERGNEQVDRFGPIQLNPENEIHDPTELAH